MTFAKRKEWYLEYEITVNRAGLLGDISSLLGMLGISIVTINGVDQGKRGLLIKTDQLEKVERFEQIVKEINEIEITKLRVPELRDRLAVRHGRYIEQDADDKKTFKFEREDLGLLVRVGKTESIVAGSVCAHKRWLFISSTLIKQTVRRSLFKGEYDSNHVYIIDGAVTARELNPEHQELVREVMTLPSIKVVEHPDLFVESCNYNMEDFDYIIELRENEDQEIRYEEMKKHTVQSKNNLDFGDPFGGGFGFFE